MTVDWITKMKEQQQIESLRDDYSSDEILIANFYLFLLNCDYKDKTPSGFASTAPLYVQSVINVASREHVSCKYLFFKADDIIDKYGKDGEECAYGQLSHATVLNALRAFDRFNSKPEFLLKLRERGNSKAAPLAIQENFLERLKKTVENLKSKS